MTRFGPVLVALLASAGPAWAHPSGYHKKIVLSVSRFAIDAVLVMDVDAGERCQLLRGAADANGDKVLSPEETGALKKRLVSMATRALKVGISSFPIPMQVKDVRVSLHEDNRVSNEGLSVALMLEGVHPHAVSPGMSLELEDSAPDLSTIAVEVSQLSGPDGGPEGGAPMEVESGKKLKVRLEALAPRP